MRKHLNYITWAALLLLTACQKEMVLGDQEATAAVELKATIAGNASATTKANTEGNGTIWTTEDKIAIRNTAKPDYFTYIFRNEAWGPDGNDYLKWDGNSMNIAAYYPATAEGGNFTLPTDQSDTLKLRSADFMSTGTITGNTIQYADTTVARNGESLAVNLIMHHRMAKVILNFTSRKSTSGLRINSAYAGYAEELPTGDTTAIIPQERVNQTTGGQTYTAIVVPAESGKSNEIFLRLEENGSPYTLTGIPAMQAGYEYTYSVMFSDEKKLSLAEVSVKPWNDMIQAGSGTTTVITYAKKGFWDPAIAKEGDTYYMVCSDAKTPGYAYKPGIQLFSSTDLMNFKKEANPLATVLADWGLAAFKEGAAKNGYTVDDDEAVFIGYPYLYKGDDGWYLLYTIQDETTPYCITGYAFSPTLANAQWSDKQLFIDCAYKDKFRPMCPTIGKSGSHYMTLMVGDIGKPTYRWWQYRLGGVSKETISRNTGREYSYMAGASLVCPIQSFIYGGRLHHFYTFSDYSIANASSHLDWRNNGPADYCGTSANNPSDHPATAGNVKVLTPYQINNGTIWYNTRGAHAFEDGSGNWYVVHHASEGSTDAVPVYQIRSMHWIGADVTKANHPVPVICPEPYTPADHNEVAESDLPGTWYFGNLKTISSATEYNAINEKVILAADGTAAYNGTESYTWKYDAATHILTLELDVKIYFYVQGATNYDSGKVTFAATGVTSNSENSSYWMEKE